MPSRSHMLDHETRLSMLKLGELIFRPDPEVHPKLSLKLAAIHSSLTTPVPNNAVDAQQHAEPPSVPNEPSQQLEQPQEQLALPVINESAITVDVDDSNVHPRVDTQGEQRSNVPDFQPDVVHLSRSCGSGQACSHARSEEKEGKACSQGTICGNECKGRADVSSTSSNDLRMTAGVRGDPAQTSPVSRTRPNLALQTSSATSSTSNSPSTITPTASSPGQAPLLTLNTLSSSEHAERVKRNRKLVQILGHELSGTDAFLSPDDPHALPLNVRNAFMRGANSKSPLSASEPFGYLYRRHSLPISPTSREPILSPRVLRPNFLNRNANEFPRLLVNQVTMLSVVLRNRHPIRCYRYPEAHRRPALSHGNQPSLQLHPYRAHLQVARKSRIISAP